MVVLLHGLSYARWGFDFPLRPEQYSVARALAVRGYAGLAHDPIADWLDARQAAMPRC